MKSRCSIFPSHCKMDDSCSAGRSSGLQSALTDMTPSATLRDRELHRRGGNMGKGKGKEGGQDGVATARAHARCDARS